MLKEALYACCYIDTLKLWFPVRDIKDRPAMVANIKTLFKGVKNVRIVSNKFKAGTVYKIDEVWVAAGLTVTLQTPEIADLEKIASMELPVHTVSRCDFAFDVGFLSIDMAQAFQQLWMKMAKIRWTRDIEIFNESAYSNFKSGHHGNSSIMYYDKMDRILQLGIASHFEFRTRREFLKKNEILNNISIAKLLNGNLFIKLFQSRIAFYDFSYNYIDNIVARKYPDKYQLYKDIKRKKRLTVSTYDNRPGILFEYLKKIQAVLKEAGISLTFAHYLSKTEIPNIPVYLLTGDDGE